MTTGPIPMATMWWPPPSQLAFDEFRKQQLSRLVQRWK